MFEIPADLVVFCAVGDHTPALTAAGAGAGAELESGQAVERNGLLWVRSEPSSVLVIGPPDTPAEALPGSAAADDNEAIGASLAAGRPALPANLRERHTAHMLNLDRLGAISFTKGCYPGQEIVARTENLGTVKRRLSRFAVASGPRPAAGDAIIDADDQSVGDINRVAATDQGFQLLAVVPVDSDAGPFRLESDGRALTALPLST
jgi:folate-binding protein YgfZ